MVRPPFSHPADRVIVDEVLAGWFAAPRWWRQVQLWLLVRQLRRDDLSGAERRYHELDVWAIGQAELAARELSGPKWGL